MRYLIIILITFFLIGCGGGDSSSSTGDSSSSTGGSSSNTGDTFTNIGDTFTGIFEDSNVSGLNYECSSSTEIKTTNSVGEFTCNTADSITFYIGNLKKTVTSLKAEITPDDLFPDSKDDAYNLAHILQNIDNDLTLENKSSANNGIKINAKDLENMGIDENTFNGTPLNMGDLLSKVGKTEIITLIEAVTHYAKTLKENIITTVGQEILDPFFKYAWHIENKNNTFESDNNISQSASANIKKAWSLTKGVGSVIAIIDDSFNASHEDLRDNVIATYDAVTKTTKALDEDFLNTNGYGAHGTAVAGIAAASANSKGIIGVAPDAKLILIAIGANTNTDSQIIDAFDFAMKNGAHVVSCSWGTFNVSTAVNAKIKELYDNNITVVFASGNNGLNLDNPHPDDNSVINDESELPWVIGVGSSTEAALKKSTSNYGKRIDILAPSGENIGIVTTDEMGTAGLNSGNEDLVNANYTFFNGTSASTPIVAGVVALLHSADASLTPAQIREVLITTADKIGNVSYNDRGWNDTYAYGKVNAYAALKNILNITDDIITDTEEELVNADPNREINIDYRGTWGISGSYPVNGATGVDVNVHPSMTGNGDPMTSTNASSSNVILQVNNGTWADSGISLSYSGSGQVLTSTPATALAASTLYRMKYTTNLQDDKGDQLASITYKSFTTGAPADVTAPTISGVTPTNTSTNVALNSNITVTFDEAMSSGTITNANIYLTPAATGTVTLGGNTATLNPTSNLTQNTQYTLTVTTGVQDAAGNGLASTATYTNLFTTIETTPPTVNTPISPASAASGVAIDSNIVFTFSEAMDNATLIASNIYLKDSGLNNVLGAISISGNTVTFNPTSNLANVETYTLTVDTGVTDAVGNAMASNFTSSFTTISSDVVAPTVSSKTPTAGSTNVSVATNVTVTFSEAMNSATLTNSNITLNCGGAKSGVVTDDGTTATFNPDANLPYSTLCTVTVNTSVTDVAGNPLASQHQFTFTTEAPDLTNPTVSSVSPANGSTAVLIGSNITITFDETMASATLTNSNITVSGGVTGTVTDDGTTATFNPTSNLAYSTNYTVTVSTNVTDIAGNNLASSYNFSFTTEDAETVKPTISTINPSDTATDISSSVAITITFSEEMKASTIIGANIYLEDAGFSLVPSSLSLGTNVVTLTPDSTLNISEEYTLTITTGVQDLVGNALASNSVTTFTTSASTCTQTANPTICYSVPANNSSNFEKNGTIKIRFSEIMAASITTGKITVNGGVTGTVTQSLEGYTATFTPDSDLTPLNTYIVTIAGSAQGSETTQTFGSQATFSFTVSSGNDERDVTNEYVALPGSGLVWMDNADVVDDTKKKTWADAKTFCEDQIGTAGQVGIYNDWRLPTVYELQTLARTLSLDNDNLFTYKDSSYFWSSQAVNADTTRAYDVRGKNGTVGKYLKTLTDYVRCVRSDLVAEAGEDTKVGNTITMNSTGLVWQDDIEVTTNAQSYTFAQSYCTDSILDGATDWRLPSFTELGTIVDKMVGQRPYINALFTNISDNTYKYWSTGVDRVSFGKTYMETIDFYSGDMSPVRSDNATIFVRCVRNK